MGEGGVGMETRDRRWSREREVEERSDSRDRVWEGRRWRSWRSRKERVAEVAEMSAGIAVERCWWWWLDWGWSSLDWGLVLSLFFLPFRRPGRRFVAPPAVVINFPLGSSIAFWGAAASFYFRGLIERANFPPIFIFHKNTKNNIRDIFHVVVVRTTAAEFKMKMESTQ